jgi:hypothetical protein
MGKLRLKDDSIRFDGDIHGVLGFMQQDTNLILYH